MTTSDEAMDDDTFGAGDDDGSQMIYTTPGAQRSAFLEAMTSKQVERALEVGADTWREYADTYGVAILYAEIASINSRLKQVFWDHNPYEDMSTLNKPRVLDLLVDLGNYASFLYAAVDEHE